jgi:uncharacterized membrane protein
MRSLIIFIAFCAALPISVSAAEVMTGHQGIYSARVIEVVAEPDEVLFDGQSVERQTITFEILDGPQMGTVVTLKNDYVQLHSGEKFFITHFLDEGGLDGYYVYDTDRQLTLVLLALLFIITVIAFGKMLGVRSLISLGISIGVIVFILLPLLIAGYSPILVSVLCASAILAIAIYLTYGFTIGSHVALIGTSLAVFLSGILAYSVGSIARLTGRVTEEAVYLDIGTNGNLDMFGILLAGIMIGSLGVLDDIATTQVSVVKELLSANPKFSVSELYRRALRVGQTHVGALVNTLALAYVGAALPVILLFYLSSQSVSMLVNGELVATEIIRMLVGSIGLVLAVPITTYLAAVLFKKYPNMNTADNHHVHHGHTH